MIHKWHNLQHFMVIFRGNCKIYRIQQYPLSFEYPHTMYRYPRDIFSYTPYQVILCRILKYGPLLSHCNQCGWLQALRAESWSAAAVLSCKYSKMIGEIFIFVAAHYYLTFPLCIGHWTFVIVTCLIEMSIHFLPFEILSCQRGGILSCLHFLKV